MTTFFAVRDQIAEKLKEIADFKEIYTPANSTNVTEMSQVTPSAHVNFARINLKATSGNSNINKIGQQWAIAIACRNAQAQMANGNALNDQIGELTNKVISLLSGWEPNDTDGPLRLIDVRDAYSPAYAYVTMIFESEKFI